MIRTLGIIPARGGSKTIPKKNIRLLNGKPLIAHAIEAGLKSKYLNRIVVSTDSEEIGEIAQKYGAEFMFLRPKELAGDSTGDLPIIQHALEWLEKNERESVDKIIYLRPTTPFKTSQTIDACILKMEENEYSGLRTVTRVGGVHHPYWMYKSEQAILKPFCPEIDIKNYYQRQLLPECFRLNGVVDLMLSRTIMTHDLYGDKIGYLELSERESIDIDGEFDFDLAEFFITKQQLNEG
jgi:CMP-N-acetylneuraminic acid synthetase